LGCRNVSRIFIPEGYEFNKWEEAIADWAYLGDHAAYKNNLDYNYAIYLINQVPHIQLGHVILKDDDAFASRIGCVHYSYYKNENDVVTLLAEKRKQIQCVLSSKPIQGWTHIAFGESQQPELNQYADGVDTMKFLSAI
jgi:hypothetical protein